jgi:S1-C subfamily serine protease
MRFRWLIITLSLMLLLGILAACGGGDDDDGDDTSATPEDTGEVPTQEGEPVDASDLAKAVVHIFALADGESIWHGSGTIITKDGLILTNAHVVGTPDEQDDYDELAIGITEAEDRPASMEYIAEIRAIDYALDLAVIEITEAIDGGEVPEEFPFVSLGDSDEVGIGDEIRVLGYPGIGGETITFTRGAVSGFTSERSVGDRAWIKTDATIAGGNSGGLAADEDGNLIGVPSVVGSGADSGITDCRILEDTNGDNVVDSSDTCVPVGGFINGIRPVKLALDLIDAVQNDDEYVSPYYDIEDVEDEPSGGFDAEDVELSNLVFADGVTDNDEPTDVVKLLPSSPDAVCGFWDFEGMQDGMTWDAIWFVDGEQNDGGSIIGETWVGGESGNWWVCIFDEEDGLPDGLYELTIQIEGETKGSDAIFVGGDRELVQFDLQNDSTFDICAAWVSPTGAQNWGFEDLGADVFLDAGTVVTLDVATGTYDILMKDCDGNDVIEDYEIEIVEPSTYTVTDN